jgi:hypothetical protein
MEGSGLAEDEMDWWMQSLYEDEPITAPNEVINAMTDEQRQTYEDMRQKVTTRFEEVDPAFRALLDTIGVRPLTREEAQSMSDRQKQIYAAELQKIRGPVQPLESVPAVDTPDELAPDAIEASPVLMPEISRDRRRMPRESRVNLSSLMRNINNVAGVKDSPIPSPWNTFNRLRQELSSGPHIDAIIRMGELERWRTKQHLSRQGLAGTTVKPAIMRGLNTETARRLREGQSQTDMMAAQLTPQFMPPIVEHDLSPMAGLLYELGRRDVRVGSRRHV